MGMKAEAFRGCMMARPMKSRDVCALPEYTRFGACGACRTKTKPDIVMTIDEYETIRLIDVENLTQEECSLRMNIARTTVQAIYAEARRKIADALVYGGMIVIEGGNVRICDGDKQQCRRQGCRRANECPRHPGGGECRDHQDDR